MKDSTVFDKPAHKMTMGCFLKQFTMKTYVEVQILRYTWVIRFNLLTLVHSLVNVN